MSDLIPWEMVPPPGYCQSCQMDECSCGCCKCCGAACMCDDFDTEYRFAMDEELETQWRNP